MNINWKQKLSSRKLWMAVIAGIAGFCKAFNPDFPDEALLTVLGAAVAYIFGETYVDGKRAQVNEDMYNKFNL